MRPIVGGTIQSIDEVVARGWLAFLAGTSLPPTPFGEPAWLVAHCYSGVTWGYLRDSRWALGSDAFPEFCPRPTSENLLEARIFSRLSEILLWRTAVGLCGRSLTDQPMVASDDPTRPDDESRLLLAGRIIERRNGFTRVGDGTGAEQVLPLELDDQSNRWPRLIARHYFAPDPETGAVNVAASRLLEIR
jgi:CRISPR-associated protein (TIGR03984 family)